MKTILNQLYEYKTLSRDDARNILVNISEGRYNSSQIASFLTVFMMRAIKLEELQGFRDALLDLCLKVELDGIPVVDVCGTGGDSKDTFNISTLASFVIAGAGYKVAKHGNYGVSSVSGSSNVLEYFGLQFSNDQDSLRKNIEDANICFLHAPLFHPALRNVASVRKDLGIKTFFNMLGPMVNPAFPEFQLVGVFNLELARLYHYIYQQTDKAFQIIHSLDGYDEISLTSEFKVFSNKGEKLINPVQIGMPLLKASDLFGGCTIEQAAMIFKSVLENNCTLAQKNTVIANAAFGIKCVEAEKTIEECVCIADESLTSGMALSKFKKLLQ